MFAAAQPKKESLFDKLAGIPKVLLFLIFSAVIFIESAALLLLLSHSNLSTGLREKVTAGREGQSSSWKLYQNNEFGFEFKYPPEMSKDPTDRPGIVARFFLFENPSNKSDAPLDGLLLNMEISPYQSSREAASFIASFFHQDSKKITIEDTVIGQLIPAEIVHIEENGTSTIAENMYVFVKLGSGEILEMQMFWTGRNMEKYEMTANQMLATFKLIN